MKPKYIPGVYHALKDAGWSNRAIAQQLDVDEASVRRGLKNYKPRPAAQFLITVTPVD